MSDYASLIRPAGLERLQDRTRDRRQPRFVIPAQAGIHFNTPTLNTLDSCVRRNDRRQETAHHPRRLGSGYPPLIRGLGGWNCAVQRAFPPCLETHTNDLRVAVNGYEEGYDHE